MQLLILSFLIPISIAQEPTDPTKESNKSDDPSSEESPEQEKQEDSKNEVHSASGEIIVYGQREVERRRKILDENLQNNGYRDGKRKGDKVVYRPETVWKPSVFVYDSGWVELKKTPPRFEPWIAGHPDNKWRYISCIPPFTPVCVRAGGWLITKRRAQHSKTEVIDQHIYDIQFWQEAVIGVGTKERLEINLPDQLDNIWLDPSDRPYADRRKDIIELWATRTCTPEGDGAAEVISTFLEYEVQESKHPLTTEEITKAKQRISCEREFPIKE